LINDVLDLAKLDSGKMEALAEDFEVQVLIEEVGAIDQGQSCVLPAWSCQSSGG
jgi:signal transduction histidine kinase